MKNSTKTRLILAVWLLASLILSNAYQQIFYQLLAFPQYDPPVDTLEDLQRFLIDEKNYLIAYRFYFTKFRTAKRENSLYFALGSYLNESADRGLLVSSPSSIHQGALRVWPRFVLLSTVMSTTQDLGMFPGEGQSDFHIGREHFEFDLLAISLPKRSPLLEPFNRA